MELLETFESKVVLYRASFLVLKEELPLSSVIGAIGNY